MQRRIFSEEHLAFRDVVRRYVAEEVVPQYDAWQRQAAVPRSEWKKAAAQGLLCPAAAPELAPECEPASGQGMPFGWIRKLGTGSRSALPG